jgi:GT2 family glycosyltransferase
MTKNSLSVVIISDARLNAKVTKDCLSTLRGQNLHQIIVVESDPNIEYEGTITVHPDPSIEFNYNAFLNIGASIATGYYIAFCNNDLLFEGGWWSSLYNNMIKNNVPSGSPLCPNTHKEFGYKHENKVHLGIEIRKYIAGWCIVLDRLWYLKMGKFDERFKFWCADNSYGEQLKKHGKNHVLDCNSIVHHVQSATLKNIQGLVKEDYTMNQVKKFNKEFGTNIFNEK